MINNRIDTLLVTVLVALIVCQTVSAVEVTDADMAMRDRWVDSHFGSDAGQLPFSFQYAGRPSAEVMGSWQFTKSEPTHDGSKVKQHFSFVEPVSGLKIECERVIFDDFPAVEWIVHFENTGQQDSPLIEQIHALDVSLLRSEPEEFVIHYANGGQTKPGDFGPMSETMEANKELQFGSTHELSSGTKLPFFGVEHDNQGFIAAVGWSGSWMAKATRNPEKSMRVQAGMYTSHTESTRLVLRPGERIRTPRMLLLFWDKDRLHGHNLWRQLLLKHYVLRRGGEVIRAPICSLNWGLATAEQHIAKINWLADHKLPIEVYWIDAGWSGQEGLKFEEWGIGAANRIPRPDLFPKGLKPIANAAHQCGMKFLLWFWPHRALTGIEVGAEHPEWVLPGEAIDHGTPEVNDWMIQRYGDLIAKFRLDIFRQDGHPIIPADESPDRRGINQVRYIQGFYKFWDSLLERFPGLIIDNCAAGGRKIDIETIQRSIPLWRSDIQVNVNFDTVHMQCQTYGISSWVPVSAGVSSFPTPYSMRSGYSPGLVTQWFIYQNKIDGKDFDAANAQRLLNEYRSIREYFYGDYYPLTSYSLSHDHWMAWQFDRPDLAEGLVQAFRRKDSPHPLAQFKLHGLDAAAEYEITNRDSDHIESRSGKELMEKGLTVDLQQPETAAVLTYRKAP